MSVGSFKEFLRETDYPFCWWCGRESFDIPHGWASHFLIERAHIVNKPRLQDRRVCVLLCSRCHKLEHGEVFGEPTLRFPRPELENMLWLKMVFDPGFYCMETMARCSIRSLPDPKAPSGQVRASFEERNYYPEKEITRA